MTESDKPEGSLSEAEGVYLDEDGELTADMESLQKGGGKRESDE